jgi:hypothetical protein
MSSDRGRRKMQKCHHEKGIGHLLHKRHTSLGFRDEDKDYSKVWIEPKSPTLLNENIISLKSTLLVVFQHQGECTVQHGSTQQHNLHQMELQSQCFLILI